MSTTRAVLYSRVSTSDQTEGVSLELQLDLARKRCEERGWELSTVYTDVMSGRSDKRPQLKQLEADAKARRFEVVLVYKLDRLARSAATFYRLATLLKGSGVELVSLTEDLDLTTASGKAMVGVLAVFAEIFSDQLSERIKGAMRANAANGRLAGGIVPLGYRREAGKYILEPTEAETVREAFDAFLRLRSTRATVDYLNTMGLRTKRGLPWHHQGLKILLQNPVYCGMLAYGKNEILSGPNGKRKRRLDRSQWVTVDDVHPAIVTRAEWEEVQSIIEGNTRTHSRTKYGQARYAWSGLIRCAACGATCVRMNSGPRQLNGKTYVSPSYTCRTFCVRGKGACERYAYVSDAYLEQHVVHALGEALDATIAKTPVRATRRKAAVDLRSKQIADLEARRAREKELFRAGYSTFEEMAAAIAGIEARIAELGRQSPAQELPPLVLPGRLLDLWPALSEAGRGEFLRLAIDHCEASTTEFVVHFKPYAGLPDRLTIPKVSVKGPRRRSV